MKNILRTLFIVIFTLPLGLNLFFYSVEKLYPSEKDQKSAPIAFAKQNSVKDTDKYFSNLLNQEITVKTDKYKVNTAKLDHCKALIYRALKSLPETHSKQVKKVTFMFDSTMRRGYGGQTSIRIRCVNVTDEELVSVFTHEVAHLVDTGLKNGHKSAGTSPFKDGDTDIYNDDPSLKYYQITWSETGVSTNGESEAYCSGYGQEQDQFEDFAECYNLYIHQGSLFRQYAKKNEAIAEKYQVLKETFFSGKEYGKNEKISKNINPKIHYYDTTILPYNLSKFLNI